MTEVLRSPSHLPSSPRRSSLSCNSNDEGVGGHLSPYKVVEEEVDDHSVERKRERRRRRGSSGGGEVEDEEEISLVELFLTVLRKSLLGCKTEGSDEKLRKSMEIGWPTEVRHIVHVTFDRFHGFLGLPVEFEPEVPRRAPSASTNVFGVSTESMQCDYDSRGNSVPTILLLMQRCLYEQGGLQVEGIFRITAENSQEEYVRDQLNHGIVPEGIDVHCLACLIKAWFRELPSGLLDTLSSEQMMQCQTEEDCIELTRLLPPTEAALLDWAVNLMADVVQEEEHNKMNARNVATVFAPNMTQMADPLTALMYAVQVMNFLRMLILKTVKGRQDSALVNTVVPDKDPSDENGHQSSKLPLESCEKSTEQDFVPEKPALSSVSRLPEENSQETDDSPQTSHDKAVSEGSTMHPCEQCENAAHSEGSAAGLEFAAKVTNAIHVNPRRIKLSRTNSQNYRKGRKSKVNSITRASLSSENSKGVSIVSRINSKAERVEAWR